MKQDLNNTTGKALLGMLSLRAMSGYELRQAIAGSIGNFWSESYGQIYPTLKMLEREGLVTGSEGGRAGSTVYALTEAGREQLVTWLGVSPRPQVNRDEGLLKLFFGNLLPAETVREHVEERRRRMAGEVARFAAMEPILRRDHAGHPGLPYWLMTLRYGMAEAKMTMAWCEETLAALSSVEGQKDEHRGHGGFTEEHGEERHAETFGDVEDMPQGLKPGLGEWERGQA